MKGNKKSHGMMVGIALIFALMFVLNSFAVAGSGTKQDDELILRIAMQDDLKVTNPLTAGDVWTWNVIGYLYDGPISVNPDTDELIPYIAVGSATTSTSIDAGEVAWDDCVVGDFGFTDSTTWGNEIADSSIGEAIVFYDFDNVYWHDGVQMDIRDVMFSMHVTAQVPEWSSSMNCLKDSAGKTGSNYTTTSWLNIYQVWESDDHLQAALKFVLTEPYAGFFRGTLSTFLLPEHIWAYKVSGQNVDGAKIFSDPGYDIDSPDSWKVDLAQAYTNPNPVGNGPFKWDHWEVGQLSKITTWRDHFYNEDFKYSDKVLDSNGKSLAGQPNIDAMVFKIYKTAEAAVLALRSDDIDYIAWSVPPTFVQELANEKGIALQQSPEQGFFYLAYNMRNQAFGYDDSKSFPYAPDGSDDLGKPFRKAVAHCIDKNRIVQRLLLNFGIGGEGPVSSISSWFNDTIPRYGFDPAAAITILENAGYTLDDPSADPGPNNHWNLPASMGGGGIGSADGGLIEILTPEANYDPIRAQAGLMIAQQLQDIGINAKSVAMDFGSIVNRINNRDFDMYILGWRIGSDPTDFLYAFFHSSAAAAGQNYPGYQNQSFDEIIESARQTGDETTRKKAVADAQAAIVYDLPYDVLYYRTNIEAYRADRFTNWQVGSSGSIFNWGSIMNLRAPSKFKTNAQFVSPPSAVVSNSTDNEISIFVKDQDGNGLDHAHVVLNASMGTKLDRLEANTSQTGKITVHFTAPWNDVKGMDHMPGNASEDDDGNGIIDDDLEIGWPGSDDEDAAEGIQVTIQIISATYSSGDIEYDPAPSRLTLVMVYPEGQPFLSVSMKADPDVIDPDVGSDGTTFGFTHIEVTVTDENGDPVNGATVGVSVSPAIPVITPAEATTDADGKATFTLTATDLPNDDGSIVVYLVTAYARDTNNPNVKPGDNSISVDVVDKDYDIPDPNNPSGTPFPTFIMVASLFCVAAVGYGVIRRKK